MNIARKFTAAAAAAATAALLAAPAAATDLRFATGFAPNSTGEKGALAWADHARDISGGDLNIQVFAQSLLKFTEMSGGVRDGIADMGMVLFPYFPAEYPNSTMISELTMLFASMNTGDRGGIAWAGALTEYITQHCPACVEEMKAQNQIYTSSSSTEYLLMCTKEVKSLADMQGIRLRAPGAQWTRWAQSVGATTVSIPQPEIFEGLTQGILDCSLQGAAELVDLSLIDAVKYIVRDVPGGGFGGTGQVNVNIDTWQALTPEQRTDLLKSAAYHGAVVSWNYHVNNKAALEKAAEKGIGIIDPADDLRSHTVAFIENDLANIARNYQEKYGLKDTEQAVATFKSIFERWTGLVADVQSAEELTDLYWNEALSKVDVNAYGF
ncbi:C4-dicarboxylate TRAP transporter substrate-binding protein [Ruixingdingia sedimenti]|uniref:C4-dicarboxylate TRAP transporter substrate-binding protein n=1 Tax=Ruixingdingia sedimenti TaxID=3073604 RepID=A0ABU1F319_9RHOB|nr:C4-dicarboxylate TRAP transporter substrate-binding protein [Xinfangfangia sp. LG-4]MDR5651224.1 C4-dicarboxylate TRAP transporter substrate-binding protein [Xinfangfangia sp. LG-4]